MFEEAANKREETEAQERRNDDWSDRETEEGWGGWGFARSRKFLLT